MLFVLKKVIGTLLMPLPFFMLMLLLAMLLIVLKRRSLGHKLGFCAIFGLYLVSIAPVAKWIAEPLELAYPRYDNQPVEFVVVLGGWHSSDDRKPVTSLLSEASLMRLSEGVRIVSENPSAKLLLSGYSGFDEISNAEAMARVAESMGIDRARMVLNAKARDTDDEAKGWAEYTEGRPFALVTTATHMTRAMYLFNKYGAEPIPAPTGFKTLGWHGLSWRSWVPSEHSLKLVTAAWHEYLGLAWAKIRT